MNFLNDVSALQTLSFWANWISIGLVFISGFLQIRKRHRDSNFLNGLSIALVFLSGFLQLTKFLVDRREGNISASIQERKLNPYERPIQTGNATVEIIVESNEQISAHYLDAGGYLAFGEGSNALMVMSSNDSYANQIGNKKVVYKGVFNLSATDSSIGKPVIILQNAEYLQINFTKIPRRSKVIGGKAIIIINSSVHIEIPIPWQIMEDNKIFNRDLRASLSNIHG